MAYESLRDYLSFLEGKGALARISGPVSPRHEITEIQSAVSARG